MSARKRKFSSEILPVFQSIQDILIHIKPILSEGKRSVWSSLIADLYKVAALAESITQQRPRTNKDWLPVADTLDREGVNLWNVSGPIRGGADDASREVVAALRYAGFRLIEAGLEQKQFVETLIHVLQLASKAAASLSEIGRHDVAANILACAAKYEEQLRTAEDTLDIHQQAKAQAVTLYYSSRMEAAWREGNDGVADFMLQKITDNDQRLPLLLPRDRESLASKLLEIGKAVLKSAHQTEPGAARGKYQTAVKWIQKAFAVIEQSEDVGAAPTLGNLKRSILRCLARAYFMSSSVEPGNLDRAEASLNELIDTIDSAADRKSPEHQQLRWMRVAVLKRRKAAESQLLDAFQSIIDHMDFSEECVTEVLQELRTLTQYHILVTSVHRHALQKALEAESNSGLPFVDRLLLSLLYHCSKDDNHGRAMQNIETAFACFNQAEYELPKIQTTACLTLLWQFGNRHYNAKRWTEAAGWFLCGTNQVLASMARASHAKCFRKAALCYIQHGDFAAASAVLRRCPGNEATTYYVVLLTAVRQGLQDPAIKAVRDMVKAPDFDRKMLLLATQLANESDMKPLLLSVLEALLETLANQETHEIHTEAITLIRCIVRLVVKLMGEPGANSSILVPTLIGHLNTAKTLIESFHATKRSTIIAKDVSWLWRTAYNCAVQGCAEWENSEEAVSDLFDIARNLLEVFCASALTDVDPELYVYLTNASFAAVSGKVFALRRRLTHTTAESSVLADISEDIATCTKRIQKVLDGNKLSTEDVDRARSFIHLLRVFDTEVSCLMKDWKHLLESIQQVVQSDPGGMDTFEAIADILWAEKDCPVEVLFAALEAILHASLDRMSLSVEKFARWLRAISTILLARNSTSDRTKAVGYVEQAVAVLEEHSQNLQEEMENVYPMDERQWLLGTSYNTGIECLYASLLDEAKRWFELSTIICRFVPDGTSRAAKISETYSHLLARYTRTEVSADSGSGSA